jgi:SAM-dependent methyltransferase
MLASKDGLPLRYYKVDINEADFGEEGFDLVVNHAAAHHITLIDKVFRAICASIAEDGIFLSYDYIGPHRNQYYVSSWQKIWEVNKAIPQELRHPRLIYPHYPTMLQMDPTEAVHSELIQSTFSRYFFCDRWVSLGGAIAYPLLCHNTAMKDAPELLAAPWLSFVINEDSSYLIDNPDSSLFAFFYGRPRKEILANSDQLLKWQEEELERELRAQRNAGRYYEGNVISELYEKLESMVAISPELAHLLYG